MEYDKDLLKTWCQMEDWGTYLDKNGALGKYSSKEGFDYLEKEYFDLVKERINYCKQLLKEHEDALVYYTLAELYDRCNLDESKDYLFKRPVRYYIIKSIREDRQYAAPWSLLAEAYSWIALLGSENNTIPKIKVSFEKANRTYLVQRSYLTHSYTLTEKQKGQIRYIEKAIFCIRKALKIEPFNEEYKLLLEKYYSQRNQEYKPEGVPRIMAREDIQKEP